MLVAGVDIGGSHITSALINLRDTVIIEESVVRMNVDAHAPAGEIIAAWSASIRASLNSLGLSHSRIGIAMPGPLDYERGICMIKGQDKFDSLYQRNIKELLARELAVGSSDIRFTNDACAFLRGEVLGDLEQRYSSIMGFTLGTGLGSAHYQDGRVADADLWRMPFRESIAEEYLVTRWFLRRYQELSGLNAANVKELLGRPDTAIIFQEFGRTLAEVIERALVVHPSEAIVLGGNIARSGEHFLQATLAELRARNIILPLHIATRAESAALIGAAGLWKAVTAPDMPF